MADDSRMRSPSVASIGAICALLLMISCTADTALIVDPYFDLLVVQNSRFVSRARRAAQETGRRLTVVAVPLEAGDRVEEILAIADELKQVDMLLFSPLLALEARRIAELFADRLVVLIGVPSAAGPSGADLPNLRTVYFERLMAMQSAAQRIAEYVGDDAGRPATDVVIFVLAGTGEDGRQSERQALKTALLELEVRAQFETVSPFIANEELTRRIGSALDRNPQVVGLLLGPAIGSALDALGEYEGALLLEQVGGADYAGGGVRFSIENDWEAAIEAAARLSFDEPSEPIGVPSVLIER